MKGIPLPPFEADVALAATGKFERANIRSSDKKIEVAITPKNDGFEVDIAANDWQPPFWPNLTFSELHAKAMATSGGMRISEIEGRLYSGKAKGSATIKWGDFWSAEGDLNIENILLAGAMPALTKDIELTGKLDAKTVYSMQSKDLGTLFDNPRIKASFNVRDGAIGNIDLARAIQPRATETTGGKNPVRQPLGKHDAGRPALSIPADEARSRPAQRQRRGRHHAGQETVRKNQRRNEIEIDPRFTHA